MPTNQKDTGGINMTKKNYITTNCNNCNNVITKIDKGRNQNYYCDMRCYREFQRSGKYKIDKAKTGEYVKCSVCGGKYYQVPSKKKEVIKNFCSRKCYLKDHAIKNKERKCKYCGNIFIAKSSSRKYCSKECDNAAWSKRKGKVLECKQCGTNYCAMSARITGGFQYTKTTFCSDNCWKDFLRTNEERKKALSFAFSGNKHPLWLGGRSNADGHRGEGWKNIREICFSLHNNKCDICGMTREEHNIKYGFDMHIDHIKAWHYFSKYEKDKANNQSNLRPLCVSCHSRYGDKADIMTKKHRSSEYAQYG